MPSAANVKVDKPISSAENALADTGNSAMNPLRQAIIIIEHKIRNLEKRKVKLESYRDMQNAGKELNSDQKTALAKISEVTQTLDFARDLYKQFLGIASTSEKEAKKQAKREASLKNQAELARLREILLVQDALNQMGNETVRDDFLNGRNGAAQLSEVDLKLLDDLYPAVTPKHDAGNPTFFTNEVQAAAEHLLAVVDGKPKEVFGGTYSQVKEILGKIHESGYFDQAQEPIVEEENHEIPVEAVVPPLDQSDPLTETSQESNLSEATNHPALHGSAPGRPPVVPTEQTMPPVPPHQVPPAQAPRVIDPAPVGVPLQAPPQDIYYQQPPPPQPQPTRPLAEMLGGTGNFFFLQESEIDTPEQIPTQTFTNQSFVVPSQMPLPQHFQQPPPQHMPAGNLPPTVNAVPPQAVAMVPPQGAPLAPSNEDPGLNKPLPQAGDEMEKHIVNRVPPPQNRGPAPNSQPPHHQQQAYYNNGYNGSRPSTRPPQPQHARNNGVHQGRLQNNRH
ncbi:uncharacterized protein LOC143204693 isoform X2 [Rhynchophorus ferrugineus]|uniref:uncharacterized protein LOC143204693 isoform X2 n=1 Tax=Rhynchophorus ferrugineus TaxID=354439 RepID=UPI003FCD3A48